MGAEKPYGWMVEVEFSDKMIYCPGWHGNEVKSFGFRTPYEKAARKKAMLKIHARAVLKCEPLNQETFERIFGLNQRM
jgi:hypothetical protein